MSREHWLILGGFVAVVGAQVATLPHWKEALTPQFIGSVLALLALQVKGIFSDKPEPKP